MMIINPITKKTNHGWVRQPSTTLIPRFRSIQSKSLLLVDDDNNDNGDDDGDDDGDGDGDDNYNDDGDGDDDYNDDNDVTKVSEDPNTIPFTSNLSFHISLNFFGFCRFKHNLFCF